MSAVSYAVYLFYSGEMVQRLGSLRLVGLSVLNATLCTVVPVMMVMMAIERIGSGLAAQVGMVGPMSTMIMEVVVLSEPFTAWLVGGTVLVLAGIFVCSRMAA